MIDAYEKIIMTMRNQSNVASPFVFGIMDSSTECMIGELRLTEDDMFKLDGVSVSAGDTVLIARVDDSYVIMGKVVE